MKTDGLVPIAFADKDGWPAFGTFDYLNMRINGYQFHMDLMAHKAAWDDPKVKKVFQTWKDDLFPLQQDNPLGRTWQEAAQSLNKKEAGMYLLGMFVAQQFTGADLDDLDFFAFPEIDSAVGADAVEAPIDGFMVSANGLNPQSTALMGYLGSAEAQLTYLESDASQHRGQQDGRHEQLQPAAEEGGRTHRRGQEHLAVPGSRQPARLRQPGGASRLPAVHQGRRRGQGHQRT